MGVVWSCAKIKKKRKMGIYQLISSILLGGMIYLFLISHSTWIEYNDWWVINNNLEEIKSRYGDFDYEIYGERWCVGYHVFYNNGPLMPDYSNYFYVMEADEAGIVYEVYLKAMEN